MSAFNAGSIRGSVDLDTTSFQKGFQEAHTHAETHGAAIREKLEAIATVVSGIVGPALAEMGEKLQSAFAGFSEGPIVGSLNAIGNAVGFVRESFFDVSEQLHTLGLEAEKAGVSVEFMDRFANVASTAQVGIEQVGMGFKILEQQAQAASEGDKKASESFERLGINAVKLAELMKSPQALFEAVQNSIGQMTSAFDRSGAAHSVLERQGSALIPIFAMTREEFDNVAGSMDRLSGGVSDGSVKMAKEVALLEAYFHKAMEGIEKAVATPVMQFLSAHISQIEPQIESAMNTIGKVIADVWQGVGVATGAVVEIAEKTWTAISPIIMGVVHGLENLYNGVMPALMNAMHALGDAIGPLLPNFGSWDHVARVVGDTLEVLGTKIGQGLSIAVTELTKDVKALPAAFEAVYKVVSENVSTAFDALAKTPLGPVMEGIAYVFHKVAAGIEYAAQQAMVLFTSLQDLANLGSDDSDFKMTVAAGNRNPDQARAELASHGAIDDRGKGVKLPGSTNVADARAQLVNPDSSAPVVSIPGASSAAQARAELSKAQGSGFEQRTPGTRNVDQARQELVDSGSASPNLKLTRSQLDAIPELFANADTHRSLPGDPSLYSASANASPMSHAPRENDSIGKYRNSHNQTIPDGSLNAWRQVQDNMPDSITQRRSAGDGGNGSATRTGSQAGNVSNAYTVHVTATNDPKATAAALAPLIADAIQKAQKQSDQKTAGAAWSAHVHRAIGGG